MYSYQCYQMPWELLVRITRWEFTRWLKLAWYVNFQCLCLLFIYQVCTQTPNQGWIAGPGDWWRMWRTADCMPRLYRIYQVTTYVLLILQAYEDLQSWESFQYSLCSYSHLLCWVHHMLGQCVASTWLHVTIVFSAVHAQPVHACSVFILSAVGVHNLLSCRAHGVLDQCTAHITLCVSACSCQHSSSIVHISILWYDYSMRSYTLLIWCRSSHVLACVNLAGAHPTMLCTHHSRFQTLSHIQPDHMSSRA